MRAIVIGDGVNELVAAHYLARSGHEVLLLAGRARPFELEAGWVPPVIARDLGLEGRGLEVRRDDPWIAAPLPDGGRLALWRDPARSAEAIRKLSARDAAKWPAFCERMAPLARVLEKLYLEPPPDPMSRAFGDLARLAGLGLALRRLGRQGIDDLLRLAPISVADFLDDWFESDALKGILGAAGIAQLCQGPRSGGTALRLLHHHVGSAPGVFRQPLANVRRVLMETPGIAIRRDVEVIGVSVREDRVAGIVLAGGEEVAAATVVSGADPRRTLTELVDPGLLDPELVRTIRNVRGRGVAARVHLTLERAPAFGVLAVAPTLDYLERAYDDAKYGRISRAPYLEARSDGRSADGRHRVEVLLQYAPHTLAEGAWDDQRRAALGDLVLKVLSGQSADFGSAVVERVVTPRDMEQEDGFPEGQAEHAEPALDQWLWMRPVPELARYRTPITGLYLCGPAMHPGGGIAGACGYNAAREVLRDLK